jgi:hypothetical protein
VLAGLLLFDFVVQFNLCKKKRWEVIREAEGWRREESEATEVHARCHRGESTCVTSIARYASLKCFDHSK